jgi:predicted nucleic acid-binding protein
MKALYVDTAGWMSLADANDPQHETSRAARDDWLEAGGILVSTHHVEIAVPVQVAQGDGLDRPGGAGG